MQVELFEVHRRIENLHWWFTARREILFSIAKAVLPTQTGLIVDIGCGTGGNLAHFAAHYRAAGVDISPEAIACCRECYPGIEFHNLHDHQAVQRTLNDASLVLLNDVLEHVSDDAQFLKRIVEQVSKGCHLLVSVPADMSLWGSHDEVYGHYRRYDREELKSCWLGLPVTCRLLSYFNSRLYYPIRLIRWFTAALKLSYGVAGSDLRMSLTPINNLLRRIFAGETRRLVSCLAGTAPPYDHGVSLLALLRRD